MPPRPGRRGRKIRSALGDPIRAQLEGLRVLAQRLNGEGPPALFANRDLVDAAAEIVEAAGDTDRILGPMPYPPVPAHVAARFNALADGAPLHYLVGIRGLKDQGDPFWLLPYRPPVHLHTASFPVHLRTASAQGVWVVALADFLINPQRGRFRRCPVCHRWFVDETRNRSARRCSRKCTIVWSNDQRGAQRKGGVRP